MTRFYLHLSRVGRKEANALPWLSVTAIRQHVARALEIVAVEEQLIEAVDQVTGADKKQRENEADLKLAPFKTSRLFLHQQARPQFL